MDPLDWLIARPLAHRGLHDTRKGVIENTTSAFSKAIAGGYGIECDVQISADGEAMVHHDDTIDRLTEGKGRLAEMSATALKSIAFKDSADRMLTLGELCDFVGARATLLIEMKSQFDGNPWLPKRVTDILSTHTGPAAVMSFDSKMILTIRDIAPAVVHGLVAEHKSAHFLPCVARTRPQFIAYRAKDLPAVTPAITRYLFGTPILAWTVRDETDRRRSYRWADQMIFEGWQP